jgi:hypothetical protein
MFASFAIFLSSISLSITCSHTNSMSIRKCFDHVTLLYMRHFFWIIEVDLPFCLSEGIFQRERLRVSFVTISQYPILIFQC